MLNTDTEPYRDYVPTRHRRKRGKKNAGDKTDQDIFNLFPEGLTFKKPLVPGNSIFKNMTEVPADLEYSPLMIAVVKEIELLSPVLNAIKESVRPAINAIYLVKKPGFETYARAKILHVKGDRISVFFIDFLVSGVVDVKHVKIFPNVPAWQMYPDHM